MTSSFTCCDCDVGMEALPDNSIDLIFTDPPYIKEEYYYCNEILAKHVCRILKPSGYLILYSGHFSLDVIFEIFRDSGLKYYWLCAQMNSQGISIVHARNVMAFFKPIIIYQKPPVKKAPAIFIDVIRGLKSKEHHPWEQSIHDALHLLSRFTVPGQVVLDPFTGSGTTLLAAKLLGLDYIGFEIDPDTYQIACRRLEQRPLDLTSFWEEDV